MSQPHQTIIRSVKYEGEAAYGTTIGYKFSNLSGVKTLVKVCESRQGQCYVTVADERAAVCISGNEGTLGHLALSILHDLHFGLVAQHSKNKRTQFEAELDVNPVSVTNDVGDRKNIVASSEDGWANEYMSDSGKLVCVSVRSENGESAVKIRKSSAIRWHMLCLMQLLADQTTLPDPCSCELT